MGLVSMIFGLPLAPVRGLKAVAEIVRDQVDLELRSPQAIQRRLEELQQEYDAGRLTEEQLYEAEQEVLNQVV